MTQVKVEEYSRTQIIAFDQAKFQNEWSIRVANFIRALIKLQYVQFQEHNNLQPKYPIVLEKGPSQFYIHLGNIRVELNVQQCMMQFMSLPYSMCDRSITKQLGGEIRKKPIRRCLNPHDQKDTKNIPKNYCKAIITYAQKNPAICLSLLGTEQKVQRFLEKLSKQKKDLLNIKVFSRLLQQSQNPEEDEQNRAFRIISRLFIKKYAINYIFNSKIVQENWHLKYRFKIYKGVQNPSNFNHIKNL
ncbi:hypothetical protein pb186bvf_015198 [Paramecium bursaria]